jgi:hypothetical protein
MVNLNIAANWNDEKTVIEHLAGELVRGRLGLLLGAGISQFYKVPTWQKFVDQICARCKEPLLVTGDDLMMKIAAIRVKHFKNKQKEFLKVATEELYRDAPTDFEELRKSSTLAAIGALVMASQRGGASKVITFNYDDLLETYLEYHGFVTSSIFKAIHWAGNPDVTIYHPHGFLPRNASSTGSEDIVFGTNEYMSIIQEEARNLWRPLLQTVLRTHTCIYVGLSGADIHLQSLLAPLRDQHAISGARFAFHGVRFAVKATRDPDVESVLASWGVYSQVIDSYDDIAPFLFRVCQAARRLRMKGV